MSYEKLFELSDVVKSCITDNYNVRSMGSEILDEYQSLSQDELSDRLYKLVAMTVSFTAARMVAHMMDDAEMKSIESAIVEIMSLKSEGEDDE